MDAIAKRGYHHSSCLGCNKASPLPCDGRGSFPACLLQFPCVLELGGWERSLLSAIKCRQERSSMYIEYSLHCRLQYSQGSSLNKDTIQQLVISSLIILGSSFKAVIFVFSTQCLTHTLSYYKGTQCYEKRTGETYDSPSPGAAGR